MTSTELKKSSNRSCSVLVSEYQEKEFPEVIARLRAFVNEFSYREFCIKVNDSPDDADSSKIYFVLINPKTGLSINLCAHRLGNFYSGYLEYIDHNSNHFCNSKNTIFLEYEYSGSLELRVGDCLNAGMSTYSCGITKSGRTHTGLMGPTDMQSYLGGRYLNDSYVRMIVPIETSILSLDVDFISVMAVFKKGI